MGNDRKKRIRINSYGFGAACVKCSYYGFHFCVRSDRLPQKNLSIIVPSPPGAGTDIFSRLLTSYLKKYLPNNPEIIVKNMPGAGGLVGLSSVLKAQPDGYTLGISWLPALSLMQILGVSALNLDEVTWIGTIAEAPHFVIVPVDSPYHSLADMQRVDKSLKSPIHGFQDVTGSSALIASQALKIKTTFIPGVDIAPGILTLLRGDADYATVTYAPATVQLEAKRIKSLWVYAEQRLKELPDTPTIVELGYPELVTPSTVYWTVLSTPHIPEEATKILRLALQKAVTDPEFEHKMKEAGQEAHFRSAGEVKAIVESANKIYKEWMGILKENIK